MPVPDTRPYQRWLRCTLDQYNLNLSYRWSWPKAPCGAEDIDLLEFEATTEFLWNEEKINEYIKDETEKILARRAKWDGIISQMKELVKDKE